MEKKRLDEVTAERKTKQETELAALKLQNEAELKVIFSKLKKYDIGDNYFRRIIRNVNMNWQKWRMKQRKRKSSMHTKKKW